MKTVKFVNNFVYPTGEPHMSFLDSWILLGLRNTAGAEILEGDVWGALKSKQYVVRP